MPPETVTHPADGAADDPEKTPLRRHCGLRRIFSFGTNCAEQAMLQ